jgi:hypothetical protein
MAAPVRDRGLQFAITLGREVRPKLMRAELELIGAEAQLAETPHCPDAQRAVLQARQAVRDLIEPFKSGDENPYAGHLDEIDVIHLEQEWLMDDLPAGEIRTALAQHLARRERDAYDGLAAAATEPPLLRPCESL